MRISDWISDVCSSDLTLQAVGNPRNLPQFVETNLDLLRVQGQPAPAGIGNNGGIPEDFLRMKTSTKYLNLEYAPGPVTVTSTTAGFKYPFEQEVDGAVSPRPVLDQDRKSTRLNSSHKCASRMR